MSSSWDQDLLNSSSTVELTSLLTDLVIVLTQRPHQTTNRSKNEQYLERKFHCRQSGCTTTWIYVLSQDITVWKINCTILQWMVTTVKEWDEVTHETITKNVQRKLKSDLDDMERWRYGKMIWIKSLRSYIFEVWRWKKMRFEEKMENLFNSQRNAM